MARECHPFIPEEKAQFIWDDEGGVARALVVLPQGDITATLRELNSSTGADTAGWPTDDYNNPHIIFGTILGRKWETTEDYIEAIAEVAKIDSADWARRILRGIAWEIGAFADEELIWKEMESIEVVELFRNEIIVRLGKLGRTLGTE